MTAEAGRGLSSALTRYRIMAWVTGTFLVILCCVGVPLKYAADQPTVVSIVGPLHGFLYIVYLIAAYDLLRRVRWRLPPSLAVLLAGTIPFLTFLAEHQVTTKIRAARDGVAKPTADTASSPG